MFDKRPWMNLNGSWTPPPPVVLGTFEPVAFVEPETDLDAFLIADGTLVVVFWIPQLPRPRKPPARGRRIPRLVGA